MQNRAKDEGLINVKKVVAILVMVLGLIGVVVANSYEYVRPYGVGNGTDYCFGGFCGGNLTISPFNVSVTYGFADFFCLTSDTCISTWPVGGSGIPASVYSQIALKNESNVFEANQTINGNLTMRNLSADFGYFDFLCLNADLPCLASWPSGGGSIVIDNSTLENCTEGYNMYGEAENSSAYCRLDLTNTSSEFVAVLDNNYRDNTSTQMRHETGWNNTANGVVLYDTNANVGIGTAVPSHKLNVNGSVNITDKLYVGKSLHFEAETVNITIIDAAVGSLKITEGDNEYMTFDTTDGVEDIEIHKDFKMSGIGLQDYLQTVTATSLTWQGLSAATDAAYSYFNNDGDGTDGTSLNIFGVGTPDSVTNREQLRLGWFPSLGSYIIYTEEDGTGTLRPLTLYTEGNAGQLNLTTDGNVHIKQNLTTKNTIIQGGQTLNETIDARAPSTTDIMEEVNKSEYWVNESGDSVTGNITGQNGALWNGNTTTWMVYKNYGGGADRIQPNIPAGMHSATVLNAPHLYIDGAVEFSETTHDFVVNPFTRNVGIGLEQPQTKLHVFGNVQIYPGFAYFWGQGVAPSYNSINTTYPGGSQAELILSSIRSIYNNIDADSSGTKANFTIATNGMEYEGTPIFTVQESGDVEITGTLEDTSSASIQTPDNINITTAGSVLEVPYDATYNWQFGNTPGLNVPNTGGDVSVFTFSGAGIVADWANTEIDIERNNGEEFTFGMAGDRVQVLNIKPRASPPASCTMGDIYVDTSGAFCGCTVSGTPGTWDELNNAGAGSCA